MYKLIGFDADINYSCGTGIIIAQQENDKKTWCWWHAERKIQTWFQKHQLPHEISSHRLHLLEKPIPFDPKQSNTVVFASTEVLDFSNFDLPIFLNQQRCQWECLASVKPLMLATCTTAPCAAQWLNDLARKTMHTIDRRLQQSSDLGAETATLRRMADIAIRIAKDPAIRLKLHRSHLCQHNQ